jgi:hypothetical protein
VNFQFESLGKKACVWLECDGCSEGQQHTCFCGQGFLFFSLALFIKNSFCRCFFFGFLVTLVYVTGTYLPEADKLSHVYLLFLPVGRQVLFLKFTFFHKNIKWTLYGLPPSLCSGGHVLLLLFTRVKISVVLLLV